MTTIVICLSVVSTATKACHIPIIAVGIWIATAVYIIVVVSFEEVSELLVGLARVFLCPN